MGRADACADASLPYSPSALEQEDSDEDDQDNRHEAAATWSDRVDLGADLVPEFPIGAHGISYGIMPR